MGLSIFNSAMSKACTLRLSTSPPAAFPIRNGNSASLLLPSVKTRSGRAGMLISQNPLQHTKAGPSTQPAWSYQSLFPKTTKSLSQLSTPALSPVYMSLIFIYPSTRRRQRSPTPSSTTEFLSKSPRKATETPNSPSLPKKPMRSPQEKLTPFSIPAVSPPPSVEYIGRAQLVPQDAPPSPGAGYTHRHSFGQLPQRPAPEYTVRMQAAQQRSLSLSFEDEEAALAPPPRYASSGGRNA